MLLSIHTQIQMSWWPLQRLVKSASYTLLCYFPAFQGTISGTNQVWYYLYSITVRPKKHPSNIPFGHQRHSDKSTRAKIKSKQIIASWQQILTNVRGEKFVWYVKIIRIFRVIRRKRDQYPCNIRNVIGWSFHSLKLTLQVGPLSYLIIICLKWAFRELRIQEYKLFWIFKLANLLSLIVHRNEDEFADMPHLRRIPHTWRFFNESPRPIVSLYYCPFSYSNMLLDHFPFSTVKKLNFFIFFIFHFFSFIEGFHMGFTGAMHESHNRS